MIENDALIWLENWYTSQCDGDWEHTYGIDIKTLDNPGWLVIIDLLQTELENYKFDEVSIKRSNNDWIHCCLKNGKFQGAGSSFNLLEILNVFRDWVESKNDN
ncbi:MAG: immunity 53 family protein [Crocosphaera sp.]|nr:immunity 53 family protein [Crocosphaera sp.]